jgi:mannose-6-phosphate isomerase-like protein (cupin superfamily)
MDSVENITASGELIAIIISSRIMGQGVQFFTPSTFSQQLAFIAHPVGHVIEPHLHNLVRREVLDTKEVLVLRKGRLRVDFYDDERQYLLSRELSAGDVILLAKGGHGFEVLEEVEMIEVKQGPYVGDDDKVRFLPVDRG